MGKYLLLDGYNLGFRSFYAVPELSRSDGLPTNAIHGWVRTLWNLQDREQPDGMAVFFDLGGSQERLAIHPAYKANRGETPPDFSQQVPWLKQLTLEMGFPLIEQDGVEADDLMAAAAERLVDDGQEAWLVSADKDLAQVIRPGLNQLLPPPTARPSLGWRRLDAAGVEEKFGIPPTGIVDYLALIGDNSDNIPGIKGVGPKTACKWLKEYGNIEGILEAAPTIKPPRFQAILPESGDQLALNRKLITLRTDYEMSIDWGSKPQPEKLFSSLEKLEMKTHLAQAQKRYA